MVASSERIAQKLAEPKLEDTAFYRFLDKALPKLRRHLPHNRFGDNLYHRLLFFKKHGRWPGNQMLWNDVWYRIKTGDEILDPLRVFVSDKEHVKQYVRETVGDEYNVPTFAVLRSPAEVDAYEFPARCCIKPTQASAQVILRVDGEPIDRVRIKNWFNINYYYRGREINYRALEPKVIVEPLIFDSTNVDDFKVFCWKGVPRFVQQDFDRHSNHTRKIFDTQWNEQDFSIIYPHSTGRGAAAADAAENARAGAQAERALFLHPRGSVQRQPAGAGRRDHQLQRQCRWLLPAALGGEEGLADHVWLRRGSVSSPTRARRRCGTSHPGRVRLPRPWSRRVVCRRR